MAVTTLNPISTMATASMTRNSSDASSKAEATNEETIQKMKANLVRYARSNDRRMVLRSLMDVKQLKSLSLDVVQNTDGPLFDLEKELVEQTIVLNGVVFRAIDFNDGIAIKDKVTSAVKNSCIPMMKALCRDLCDREGVSASSREVYEKLIVRLAKTTSSADPYFRLNSLLGSPDLIVMPLDNKAATIAPGKTAASVLPPRHQGGTENQVETKPVELNIYEAYGNIHITLTQTYKFGLLRKSDVKSNRPWIVLEGVVSERSNLSSNQVVRQLKVVLPEIY